MKILEFLLKRKLIRENIKSLIEHVILYAEQWEIEDERYLVNNSKDISVRVSFFKGRVTDTDYLSKLSNPDIYLNATEYLCFLYLAHRMRRTSSKNDVAVLKFSKYNAIDKDLKDKKFSKRTEDLLK